MIHYFEQDAVVFNHWFNLHEINIQWDLIVYYDKQFFISDNKEPCLCLRLY